MKKKKQKNLKLKEVSEIVTTVSIILAAVSFLIRGYWYLYEWGYYNAIGVNRIYIDVESMGTLYYVLANLGLAGLLVFSNYIVYFLWIIGRGKFIIVFELVEVIFFAIVILVSGNIDIIEIIQEIIKFELQRQYLELLLEICVTVFIINLYGLYFGIVYRREKKRQFEKRELDVEWKKSIWFTPKNLVWLVVLIVVEGGLTFLIGMDSGNDKKDYKVVVESVLLDNEAEMADKYFFLIGDSGTRIYPILYENEEIYIVSKLYQDKGKIEIETTWQKVISKEGVETFYCKDIFAINQNKENVETKENKSENSEGENEKKMLETLAGVIVGALCTYFIEQGKRKKEKKSIECHAASLLYYDLYSIEQYLEEENKLVNLRYFNEWQNVLASCTFFSDESIMYLYKIYDEVYNYYDSFNQKIACEKSFKKEKLDAYKSLKELIFKRKSIGVERTEYNEKYEEIKRQLREKKVEK